MNTAQLHRRQAENFGYTLLTCARLFDALAHGLLNRQAGKVVAPPGLVRLVPHLTFDGIRPSDLARLTDVSKQAVSQTLAPLVEQGLVEYVDDPRDGRARRVRLTQKGGETFVSALSALRQLERALADRVGAEKLADLFEALKAIRPVLEEWSRLPNPGKPSRRPGGAA
ncbi:MAG: MarR family winged helix-turn-helix transcriptional regulator [Vicinamibacteria bacterium]|nr:MarR family winged helix-turn-helix transcriptional regulator [Vicinamibacteria bacterium]